MIIYCMCACFHVILEALCSTVVLNDGKSEKLLKQFV
jgi:hypothetical protein